MHAGQEQRKAERRKLKVDLKFLLRGEIEAAGVLLDISANGLALFTDVDASAGDEIVIYPVGLGRLTGRVVRKFKGGLGVQLTQSPSQRESLEQRIATALSGAPWFKLTEQRSALRIKYNLDTMAQVRGSRDQFPCTIVDMSLDGCRLQAGEQPAIGTEIFIGALGGVVVRHVKDGFSVKFQAVGEGRAEDAAKNVA